jgi:rubredoxin---NAD+ reductase
MEHNIIIIGTGLAGYQLAREFRKLDQHSPLTLITANDGRFYPKPQLSNALTNKKSAETLATATAENMAAQLNATILTHTHVTRINPETKTLYLNHASIGYEKLVLACGAETIKPNILGNATHEIQSINHLEDYIEFEKNLKNKKHIAILGAGLIGCEFANDLINAGYLVHVIDPAKAPLSQLIPPEIGKLLQEALEKNGVNFHIGCIAEQMNKKNNSYELTLSNHQTISAELVISAIGLKPNIALAQSTSLQTGRGIRVDRFLATNLQDIYALGDCAEVEGHVLPYIAPILNGARSLAKSLTGERQAVEYPAMPVVVKTPAHPIAVCPPPRGMKGEWKIEKDNTNTKAMFYNEKNELYGFVLTNDFVKERIALAAKLPTLF